MSFKEAVERVLRAADVYSSHGKNNPQMRKRQDDLQLVGEHLEAKLRVEIGRDDLEVKVGGQQGSYSPVPWIRIFNRKASPSAQEGYYLVYLFAADGSAVFASLNQGTSELRESGYKPSRDTEGILARSLRARELLQATNADIAERGVVKIDLRAESQKVGGISRQRIHNYERANIFALRYQSDALPDDEQITSDFRILVSALDALAGIQISVDQRHVRDAQDVAVDLSLSSSGEKAVGFASRSMRAESEFDDRLATLLKFGFGGANVAKEPNDDVRVPVTGLLPLGAKESIEWFRKSISSAAEVLPALILVGAPGNGKSFVAHEVRRLFDPDESNSGPNLLHRRLYTYSKIVGDRKFELTVVNDATIDSSAGQLIEDLDLAIASGSSFLANVNRGVLYEELQSAKKSIGSQVIRWVANESGTDFEADDGFSVDEVAGDAGAAIRSFRIRDLNLRREVRVTALYLDNCSLLEAQPSVDDSGSSPVLRGSYYISDLEVRKRDLGFVARTPAGDFAGKIISWLTEVLPKSADALDPFVANVQTMRSVQVRSNLLTTARCAEIATGSRLSYRELWGLLVTLVCGSFPDQGGRKDPREWLTQHLDQRPDLAQPSSLDEATKWLMTLGDRRLHQALFGVHHQDRANGLNPVQQKMMVVDPAFETMLDASPSISQVHEAFYGNDRGDSILELLLDEVGKSNPQSPLFDFVTDFDRSIDKCVSQILASDNDARGQNPQRNPLLKWYGSYLARLYSLAHGSCGFESEIRTWIDCWTFAQVGDGQIPDDVERGLKTLFLPALRDSRDSGSQYSYLLPFDSLTEPLRAVPGTPRLAVRLSRDNIRFRPVASGERLMVRVTNDLGRRVEERIELELDFNLLREVLASSSGDLGFTESSDSVSPRIERFRSGLVSWGSNTGHVTVVRPDDAVLICQVRNEGPL